MQIQQLLNRVYRHKGFVYGKATVYENARGQACLDVRVRPRKGSKATCSGCGERRPGYDRLDERRFHFIPVWGFLVFFVYTMRRVDCPQCGVRVERVPWADGKARITKAYGWFLAGWAKRLSWAQTAEAFRTSYYHVFVSVQMAVQWGRAHANYDGIEAIGVDEIQYRLGHRFLTLVYQIDAGRRRLLWIGENRSKETFESFFDWFGERRSRAIKYICSDMWQAYIEVAKVRIGQAIHILDRFHLVAHLNKALDDVRREEANRMRREGYEPILSKSRWCLLKKPENLTAGQSEKLKSLLGYNLKTARAYLLKEELTLLWNYVSPYWAGKFLDRWCTRAMRSRIEPVKRVARTYRKHRPLILNWFAAKKQFSSGVVEGLNNKAKLTTKRAYGFSSLETLEIALYHTLGDLPEPELAHRFF
mgnify:CR=1 FL=1